MSSLIDKDNIWLLMTIIVSIAAISIYLEQKYVIASKISGAIIALIIAMGLSNLGVIPLDSVVYDGVWNYIVPMAIPLLLFKCNILQIYKESGRLLIIFLISSIGTVFGAIVGFTLLSKHIPQLNYIAGMMTASYIGGGVNFTAVSRSFDVSQELISATVVSDNLLMVLYFFILIIMPAIPLINKIFIRDYDNIVVNDTDIQKEEKFVSLKDIAFSFALSIALVTVSFVVADFISANLKGLLGVFLGNRYLILTTVTVILATVFPKFFSGISCAQEIGTFLIYIFFVVIGIPASIISIIQNSPLLLVFCLIMVIINMVITLIFAKIFKFSLEEAILASNANIGGPTTATAMAISKGWTKRVAPSMLVGTLGYVIGNYFGILVGNLL